MCQIFQTQQPTHFCQNRPCPLGPLTFPSVILTPRTHLPPLLNRHNSCPAAPLKGASPPSLQWATCCPSFAPPAFTLHHPLFLYHDTTSFLRLKGLCYLILHPLHLVECLEHEALNTYLLNEEQTRI